MKNDPLRLALLGLLCAFVPPCECLHFNIWIVQGRERERSRVGEVTCMWLVTTQSDTMLGSAKLVTPEPATQAFSAPLR